MNTSPSLSRRGFLSSAAKSSVPFLLGGGALTAADDKTKSKNPLVRHVVVVMMENRSFDHFLGWLPGADGRQAGLTYIDNAGVDYSTYPLAPDYQGCDHPSPDHSHQGGLVEYNGGRCDGWLRAGTNDTYSIGYYQKNDLPFLGQAAPAWTACNRYFAATLAETYPNRIYQHAAQTDRLVNTLDICTLPTIWDRLADKKVSGRYYFSDVPFLALWGAKYLPISSFINRFYDDCAAGTLPAVSFVDPSFRGESVGLSNDDHPHGDIRNGEAFLNSVYEAVTSSPNWKETIMVINFDEWGGFYDHVAPTAAPIPKADYAAGNRDGLRGFRVPALVISPWSRRGYIAPAVYDHTSVLKMIENLWNLNPLTVRDSQANDLIQVLDFSRTNIQAPRFAVPQGPFGGLCPVQTVDRLLEPSISDEWINLSAMAQGYGFAAPTRN